MLSSEKHNILEPKKERNICYYEKSYFTCPMLSSLVKFSRNKIGQNKFFA